MGCCHPAADNSPMWVAERSINARLLDFIEKEDASADESETAPFRSINNQALCVVQYTSIISMTKI